MKVIIGHSRFTFLYYQRQNYEYLIEFHYAQIGKLLKGNWLQKFYFI